MTTRSWVVESVKEQSFESLYQIGEQIQSGSIDSLYQCNRKGLPAANFAVQVLRKNGLVRNTPACLGALPRLDHPNLVRFKEVYETDTELYIVSGLAKEKYLIDHLTQRQVYTERYVALTIQQILGALDCLHDNDLVFFNWKLENLLCEEAGGQAKVILTNFWHSKIMPFEVRQEQIKSGALFCAPEIIRGGDITPAADMWSVGVLTYILLSGVEPFGQSADTCEVKLKRILKGEFCLKSDSCWESISMNAKSFVFDLIKLQPSKRPTVRQALVHPWVRGAIERNDHLETPLARLRSYRGIPGPQNETKSEQDELRVFGQAADIHVQVAEGEGFSLFD